MKCLFCTSQHMRVRSANYVWIFPPPRVTGKVANSKIPVNKPSKRNNAVFRAHQIQLNLSSAYKPLKRSSRNFSGSRHPALFQASQWYRDMSNPLIMQPSYFASGAHCKGRENVEVPKRFTELDVQYKGDTLRSYERHKCNSSEAVLNFRSDYTLDEQDFESFVSDRRLFVDCTNSTKLVTRPETTVPLGDHKLTEVNGTNFLHSSSHFSLEDVKFVEKNFCTRFGMPYMSVIRRRGRKVCIFRLPRGTPTQLTTNILFQHSLDHKTCIIAGHSVIPDLKVQGLFSYRKESYSSEYRIVVNCAVLSHIGYLVKFSPLIRSIPANIFHVGQHFCYTFYAVDLQTEKRLDVLLINVSASLQPTAMCVDSKPWNLVSGIQISSNLISHCYFLRKYLRRLVWNPLSLGYGQVISIGMVSEFGILKNVSRPEHSECHIVELLSSSLQVLDFTNLVHAVQLKCEQESEPQIYSVNVTQLRYFVASVPWYFIFDCVVRADVDGLSGLNVFFAEELSCSYTLAPTVPPTFMQNVKSREKLKQNDKPYICTHCGPLGVCSVLMEVAIESESSRAQRVLMEPQVVPYCLPCAATQLLNESYSHCARQPTLCPLSVYSEQTGDHFEAFGGTKHALSIIRSNLECISPVVMFQGRIVQTTSCTQTHTSGKLVGEEGLNESLPNFDVHTNVQRLPGIESDHLYDVTHSSIGGNEATSLVFSGSNLWTCWLQQCAAASLSGFVIKSGFYGLCSDDILPITGACLALALCALIWFRKTN
ncbi:uncharacterized protein DEA37_0010590 [Paragonimus westermani]|uniref:Uncharacterized protein n=1 Tax=Paragonimus westermani TaxID=34504 RepID=A0A5J4N893_9TREM|nr:uncharacterized protein DEA37_0010590 [Paragonimus westermani]